MRLQKSFSKEIDESEKEDFFVTVEYQGGPYKVRVVKLELPTGEIETLNTSVGRNQFRKTEFQELYFKR